MMVCFNNGYGDYDDDDDNVTDDDDDATIMVMIMIMMHMLTDSISSDEKPDFG